MKIKKLFISVLTVCATGCFVMGCVNKIEFPQEESVSKTLNIAVFEASETNVQVAPVKPALLQECVALDKIIHYDTDGDSITVPFHFKDSIEYARITAENTNKRIVITADGVIVATPMVKMEIGNGACSILLSKQQAQKFFPEETIEKLLSGRN